MLEKPTRRGKRGQSMPQLDKARDIVRPLIEAGKTVSPHRLEKLYGISHYTFDAAITAELARKQAHADPPIDPETLPKSAKAKLDAAIRQHKRKLDSEYNARRMAEIAEHLKRIEPELQAQKNAAYESEKLYRDFLKRQDKMFTRAEFMLLIMCVHADPNVSPEKRTEAAQLLLARRFALTGERD